ncbi:MAG TPA: adenylate/guanylate cyclase domain-containing protein [Micromonosporaceae bacterium]|nr:adenylate/guanylate cyclase domain-containing protein [Micromonosporaceae bacterium]
MTQTLNPLLRGLEPAARATHTERRSVAVLFADISGFTALVESVDPEMVYQVVRPLMDELVLRVHLHGGEIQQVLGDGFMAVFGLTSQDGDEAERAVRAGLSLISAGEGTVHPPVHVGIESGEVLVTPSWEPAGFGVWGRPVTLAKRLCDLAGPGKVQVGPSAFARAGGGLRSAGPVTANLKGIAAAIIAHGVTALS